MPSAPKKPTQNWWVDQRLSTRGMPMRSAARGFAAGSGDGPGAEGCRANHFSSVWVGILHGLEVLLHHQHLVDVLEQSLRAGVAADYALPAGGNRYFAPGAALAVGQAYVDERALAVDRAPLARRVLVGRARVLERLDDIVAAEACGRTGLQPVAGAQRRTDGTRLAGMRVHHDLGVGHLRANEIDLRLHNGQVAVRSP